VTDFKNEGRLIYGISERDSDLLYALNVMIPDPVIWLKYDSEEIVVVGKFEVERVRRQGRSTLTVCSYDELLDKSGDGESGSRSPAVKAVLALLQERGLAKLTVPADFPLSIADELRKARIEITTVRDFFPQREVKRPSEASYIRDAVRLAEKGMARAFEIMGEATIGADGVLFWKNKSVTSELLRGEINARIALYGGTAVHTIAACGVHAADPHESGYGVIKAGQPVVIDIFPRVNSTGYHGDLTRTVVKGSPTEKVAQAYAAVKQARDRAIAFVREGVEAKAIHQIAEEFLDGEGFSTDRSCQPPYGFIHGVGHGLGLDVHERPRVSPQSDATLRACNVITIEPGLYYPGWGGIRLEDVVVVEKNGCRNLTEIQTMLEIA